MGSVLGRILSSPSHSFYRRKRRERIFSIARSAASRFLMHLSNKYVAFAFIAAILIGSYFIKPFLWTYIFTALITYFAATLFIRYSLAKGLFQVRHVGKAHVAEGHAYLAFIMVIILSTLFSNLLAGYIVELTVLHAQDKLAIVLVQTIAILALLLIDMKFEF